MTVAGLCLRLCVNDEKKKHKGCLGQAPEKRGDTSPSDHRRNIALIDFNTGVLSLTSISGRLKAAL
jgi:hypothetical protein